VTCAVPRCNPALELLARESARVLGADRQDGGPGCTRSCSTLLEVIRGASDSVSFSGAEENQRGAGSSRTLLHTSTDERPAARPDLLERGRSLVGNGATWVSSMSLEVSLSTDRPFPLSLRSPLPLFPAWQLARRSRALVG
jgi:hypothetical protein